MGHLGYYFVEEHSERLGVLHLKLVAVDLAEFVHFECLVIELQLQEN